VTCELITIEDDLDRFYYEISCRCIDIVERRFSGRLFDIICDDEALLHEDPGLPTSLWFEDTEKGGHLVEGLFGTLLLCHNDGNGNLTGATAEDLLKIQQAVMTAGTTYGKTFTCLKHDL
jgi:hypothetical protein